MSRYFPLVVKQFVTKLLTGGLNFPARQKIGAKKTLWFEIIAGRTNPGLSVANILLDAKTKLNTGVQQASFRTGSHRKELIAAGHDLFGGLQEGSRAILSHLTGKGVAQPFAGFQEPSVALQSQLPANVLYTFVRGSSVWWVDAASESAGSDWNDLANFEGDTAPVASMQEGLLLNQGTLIGDFIDPLNKDGLDVVGLKLTSYHSVANLGLPGTTMQIQYRIGFLGVPVTLKTIVGGITTNEDFTVTGEEFDLMPLGPNGGGSPWTAADLTQLQVLYNGTILVDVGLSRLNARAVKLEIEWEKVEAP